MAGEQAPVLSVVIPAFNEEQRLPRTIEAIEHYMEARQILYELILVDDGSVDATRMIMDRAAERNPSVRVEALPRNRGKGRAITRVATEGMGRPEVWNGGADRRSGRRGQPRPSTDEPPFRPHGTGTPASQDRPPRTAQA